MDWSGSFVYCADDPEYGVKGDVSMVMTIIKVLTLLVFASCVSIVTPQYFWYDWIERHPYIANAIIAFSGVAILVMCGLEG